MSEHSEQFRKDLRDRLDVIDERISAARSHIGALTRQAEDVLRAKLDEVRGELPGEFLAAGGEQDQAAGGPAAGVAVVQGQGQCPTVSSEASSMST